MRMPCTGLLALCSMPGYLKVPFSAVEVDLGLIFAHSAVNVCLYELLVCMRHPGVLDGWLACWLAHGKAQ